MCTHSAKPLRRYIRRRRTYIDINVYMFAWHACVNPPPPPSYNNWIRFNKPSTPRRNTPIEKETRTSIARNDRTTKPTERIDQTPQPIRAEPGARSQHRDQIIYINISSANGYDLCLTICSRREITQASKHANTHTSSKCSNAQDLLRAIRTRTCSLTFNWSQYSIRTA